MAAEVTLEMASHAQISHDFAAPPKKHSRFSFLLDPRTTASIAVGGILLHILPDIF